MKNNSETTSKEITLWHIYEDEAIGGAEMRSDWFVSEQDAKDCREEWLAEHRKAADDGEFNEKIVGIKKVTVPTSPEALAKWLWLSRVRNR